MFNHKTNDKIENFIIFCIELFRARNNLDAVGIFKKFGVFGFIEENFEVLHTQSEGYILSEISKFIKNNEALSRRNC